MLIDFSGRGGRDTFFLSDAFFNANLSLDDTFISVFDSSIEFENRATGVSTILSGANFTFNADDRLDGGVVTGLTMYRGDPTTGYQIGRVTEISWELFTFFDALFDIDDGTGSKALADLIDTSSSIRITTNGASTGFEMRDFFNFLPPGENLSDHIDRDMRIQGTYVPDFLVGGQGDDRIETGASSFGEDYIVGTLGFDTIAFTNVSANGGYILDYTRLEFPFGDVGPGGIRVFLNSSTNLGGVSKLNGSDTFENVADALLGGLTVVGTDKVDRFVFILGRQQDRFAAVDMGAGADDLSVTFVNNATFQIDMRAGNTGVDANIREGFIVDGFGDRDTLDISNVANGVLELRGSDFADRITGGALDEVFITERGNDTIDGGAGHDVLDYDQETVGDVFVDLESGRGRAEWDGAFFELQMSNIEEVRGSDTGRDFIAGDAGANALVGLAGRDFLYGDGLYAAFSPETAARVYRIYEATLAREPDAAGFNGWVSVLESGSRGIADVINGFVLSPEFQATYGALEDAPFIELLYNNVLGRPADDAGREGWLNNLATGMSRAEVVQGFSDSPEFVGDTRAGADQFIRQMTPSLWQDEVYRTYRATLDRDPDEAGFVGWVEALAEGRTLSEVVGSFVISAEFQATYGALDDAGFVELLYQNVLGRASDDAGRQGWLDALGAGQSRSDVVLGFSESGEFVAATADGLATWIRALGPHDRLEGGAGANDLAGGILSDLFVFDARDSAGHRVLDLEAWDSLEFAGFGYSSASDVRDHLTQVGDDVIFSDARTTITFEDTQLTDISDDMLSVIT